MLEAPVVCQKDSNTNKSATTLYTVNLHCNVLHELLCSLECVKCVCTNVKESDGFCVTVVFVETLEFYQQSYTQGRFRVYQHLNDLRGQR